MSQGVESMRKTYTYGEILFLVREEYLECRKLLDQMLKCIKINGEYKNAYITANLKKPRIVNSNEIDVLLKVEKECSLLNKIWYQILYDFHGKYLYRAELHLDLNQNNYNFIDNYINDEVGNKKKYIPKVEIKDEMTFSLLVNQLLASDLTQLNKGKVGWNHNTISMDFDKVFITSPLGHKSTICWSGLEDGIKYNVKEDFSNKLLEEILSLKIPRDALPDEWMQFIENHENKRQFIFDVSTNIDEDSGLLKVRRIDDNNNVKLIKR